MRSLVRFEKKKNLDDLSYYGSIFLKDHLSNMVVMCLSFLLCCVLF